MTAVALTLTAAFLAALGWGMFWRWQAEEPQDEVWAARFETVVWKRKAVSLEDENMRLHLELTEAQVRLADAPAPVVPLIPRQRTGHEPWPPVARAVEAETLTPLFEDVCFKAWEADS